MTYKPTATQLSMSFMNINITDDTKKMLVRQWKLWPKVIITPLGKIELPKVI